MSQEKTNALVIRQADWSESSRVVTLFTRDFGKISVIAKGVKRLRSAFEAGLDLLSECRIVFLRKSSSGLDILTESQLQTRFAPAAGGLSALYSGYYIAELLSGLTEEYDPHPVLYDTAVEALGQLMRETDIKLAVTRFELVLLREIGQLPEFHACLVCDKPLSEGTNYSYWVSQGGLICADCRKPNYEHKPVQLGTIKVLKRLSDFDANFPGHLSVTEQQFRQLRHLTTSTICHNLERRPATLRYLNFD